MATIDELEARLAALEERIPTARAAAPPITVGELTDVPAPGSPIASAWAQEISERVHQRFATKAAMTAWAPAAGARAFVTAENRNYTRQAAGWITDPGHGLARVTRQVNSAAVGAETIVNEMTTPFTVLGAVNRTIWVCAVLAIFHTGGAAGDTITARLKYDTAQFAASPLNLPVNGTGTVALMGHVGGVAPGAHTITVTLQTTGGTIQLTSLGTSTLMVVDIGTDFAAVP